MSEAPAPSGRVLLVTGAAGFAGRVLVERAVRRGHVVRAAVRTPSGAVLPAGATEHAVGPLESADWSAALDGVDTVIHLAARVHRMKDDSADPLGEHRRVNVDGTVSLAQAAIGAGVRRIVFASTVKVLGDATEPGRPFDDASRPAPGDPYGLSKLEAEEALAGLAAHGAIETTVLRPVLMYGPGVKGNVARLMRWIAAGVPLPFGAIDNRRSLLGVHNFADAALAVVEPAAAVGRRFVVADGVDLSTPELAARIGEAVGRPARLLRVPIPLLRALAAAGGGRETWQRLGGSLQVDASGLRRAVGWSAPVSIDEGLREMARAVR